MYKDNVSNIQLSKILRLDHLSSFIYFWVIDVHHFSNFPLIINSTFLFQRLFFRFYILKGDEIKDYHQSIQDHKANHYSLLNVDDPTCYCSILFQVLLYEKGYVQDDET